MFRNVFRKSGLNRYLAKKERILRVLQRTHLRCGSIRADFCWVRRAVENKNCDDTFNKSSEISEAVIRNPTVNMSAGSGC